MGNKRTLTTQERRPPILTEKIKDKRNKNLTTLKIVLWNSGSENIDKQVKIVLPDDTDIQDAKVVSTANPFNNVKIKVDPMSKNTAIISFDYLAMKEGCLISLVHTDAREQGTALIKREETN